MCTFLTVGLEARREAGLVKALRDARLEVSQQTNPTVAARFPPTHALVLVTHGGCSCDLRPSADDGADDFAERLARRGLSKGQIERALEAHRATQNQKKPKPPRWSDLLLVLQAHAPLAFLFHDVRTSPLTEELPAEIAVQTIVFPRKSP